jgi:cytochrome c oxidase subunit 2
MSLSLALILALLCAHGTAADGPSVVLPAPPSATSAAPESASARIDADVKLFNPDVYRLDDQGSPVFPGHSLFVEPVTEVARQVLSATWFSALVFLPFLILPQVLLLVIIFKFKDRGDGRAPATFLTHHKLEVIWTAIPFLAVLIVSIPTYYVLEFMDDPPKETKDLQVVTVTGKQFAWMYEYKRYYVDPNADEKVCLQSSLDPVNQLQEPLLLTKGRSVSFNLTSQDVTHAWWVPAFGVKKSAITGRFTNVWFTPDTLGVFKGQCVELCGDKHGNMIITTVVVERDEFERYMTLLRHRDDTVPVWNALQPPAGKTVPAGAVAKAVAAFLQKGDSPERQYALSYWMASNFSSIQRVPPPKGSSIAEVLGVAHPADDHLARDKQIDEVIRAKRKQVDELLPALAKSLAALPAAAATPILR